MPEITTDPANSVYAIGNFAASGNTGTAVMAFGESAAEGNTGNQVNAIGVNAAIYNSGNEVNAGGYGAAQSNTGHDVNAFGNSAANNNTGTGVNAFGDTAGEGNIFNNVNLFGYQAAADGDAQTVVNNGTFNTRFDFSNITDDRKVFIPDMAGVMAVIDIANDFADDAAAEIGNIPVGGVYHTSGVLKVRLV